MVFLLPEPHLASLLHRWLSAFLMLGRREDELPPRFQCLLFSVDKTVTRDVVATLEGHGIQPHQVSTFADAAQCLRQDCYHVVIVAGTPDAVSAEGWSADVRHRLGPRIPCCMVVRSAPPAVVAAALLAGADGVLTTASLDHLLHGTLVTLTRRRGPSGGRVGDPESIYLDALARRVFVYGRQVPMSRKQFYLLYILMCQAGTVLPTEDIVNLLADRECHVTAAALPTLVCRVRDRLRPFCLEGCLQSVRGHGYRYFPPIPGGGHGAVAFRPIPTADIP